MRNSISPNRFLLLFACLLLIVTPLRAQDAPEWDEETMHDKAWLAVYIDPYGAAHVSLEFPAAVRDREDLDLFGSGPFASHCRNADGELQSIR